MKDYIFFWGCTIPNRLPFLEKSMRAVLEKAGITFREINGFTCCPEKFLVETMSEEAWYLTAARNLALSEREGADLLVACNGCYASFRMAVSAFQSSTALRRIVTGRLAEIGLEYNFRSSVYHIMEVLHDRVGADVLARKVERPLLGMNIAVHYGCQLLRPSPVVRLDDPLKPGKLDRLVECLGATSVDYNSKLMCCGEALGRSGCPGESMASARLKLLDVDKAGADAVVVVCPACFQQFDGQQALIQRDTENLQIPVFYYTELLGLALGLDPEDMGLDMHRVGVSKFIERLGTLELIRGSLPTGFDYEMMRTCLGCRSCSEDCPVSLVDDTYSPHGVVQAVLDGEMENVLQGEDIWKCMECGTCVELCPNNFGMMSVIKRAKQMALERGIAPAETRQGIEMFRSTGVLGKARERARNKLGLGPVAESGGAELARLLKDTFKGKGG